MKTVTFPGRYDSLAKVSEFIVQAARKAELDDKAVYAVELAVDEACSNIIDHAYGGEGIGDMQCSVLINKGELTVILRDQGQPFNPEDIPDPTLNVPLQKLKPRGAGLYLMRKMMDEIFYAPSTESGNVLTMKKRKRSLDNE
ncbi:MAG: ATP-binding protein [Anaerolineales bacterium]|jgi:serine/threonine-protein kinase RsbW